MKITTNELRNIIRRIIRESNAESAGGEHQYFDAIKRLLETANEQDHQQALELLTALEDSELNNQIKVWLGSMDKGGTFKDEKKKKVTNSYLEVCIYVGNIPLDIQVLDLMFCRNLENLNALEKLTNLKKILLDGCDKLIDITGLSSLTSITQISLQVCDKISDISPLSKLTSLEKLSLHNSTKIVDLSPLEELKKLKDLNIYAAGYDVPITKEQVIDLINKLPIDCKILTHYKIKIKGRKIISG